MNVKPGDVAIIIKGRWPNVGRIVLVDRYWGQVDYSHIGCGVLPCWLVESTGGKLDTSAGESYTGYTPDLSLRILRDVTPEQAQAMWKQVARVRFDEALVDLGKILHSVEEEADVGCAWPLDEPKARSNARAVAKWCGKGSRSTGTC